MVYEFSDRDAEIIRAVGVKGIVIGALFSAGGVTFTISRIVDPLASSSLLLILFFVLQGILQIMVGLFFFPPATHFKLVDTTIGNDVPELIHGLELLARAMKATAVMLGVGLVVTIIAIIIAGAP